MIAKPKACDILNAEDIKPHRIRYYLENCDPDFDVKMHDVLEVYKQVEMLFGENGNLIVNDRPKTITLSLDEKPGIQAIKNKIPNLRPTEKHGFTVKNLYL